MMDGNIEVESVVGEGTTFRVELPSALHSAVTALVDGQGDSTSSLTLLHLNRPATLLYIEDNVSNLKVIETLMETVPDLRLLTAIQGGIGMELARQHRPDLILLDLHLPDIDGEEVLSRLQHDPTTRDIPIIILSADATASQIKKLRSAGARDYLTKPLDIQQFVRVLKEVLQGSEK